jgi:hypothetical protein
MFILLKIKITEINKINKWLVNVSENEEKKHNSKGKWLTC